MSVMLTLRSSWSMELVKTVILISELILMEEFAYKMTVTQPKTRSIEPTEHAPLAMITHTHLQQIKEFALQILVTTQYKFLT